MGGALSSPSGCACYMPPLQPAKYSCCSVNHPLADPHHAGQASLAAQPATCLLVHSVQGKHRLLFLLYKQSGRVTVKPPAKRQGFQVGGLGGWGGRLHRITGSERGWCIQRHGEQAAHGCKCFQARACAATCRAIPHCWLASHLSRRASPCPAWHGAQVRAFAQEHKLGNPVRTMAPLPISICCLLRRGWTGGACRCLQGAPLSTVSGSTECGATNDGPNLFDRCLLHTLPHPGCPSAQAAGLFVWVHNAEE